jgi:ABC-type Zn uptake system ZnuABC Zn-binding protein ZnuA
LPAGILNNVHRHLEPLFVRLFVSLLVVAIVCALLVFTIARSPRGAPSAGRAQVVATIFPLADWLREIGGEDLDVHCLVSGAGNPHHFEPSMRDAATISKAQAVFAVGLDLDPWAKKLADNAAAKDLIFFNTADWIKPRALTCIREAHIGEQREHDEHHHGANDPHFWLDPQRVKIIVSRMADELAKIDETHAKSYRARATAYLAKLDALIADISAASKRIASLNPRPQLATFHDAYGYLFDSLGITVAAVVQVSPGVEPGAKDVIEAVRIMREIGQKVVFSEPQGSAKTAQVIAEQLSPAATIKLLDPLDCELSETGKTYLERMRHNLRTLEDSLKP